MSTTLLGTYKNGNYNVTIFSDGTKIRFSKELNENDKFEAEFPESFDCKITDKCNLACQFCHENSTIKGKHGDIMSPSFIDTLHPFTEIAIGGGNPLSHPDLIPFLEKLKEKHIIANMTVNQRHFMSQQELVKELVSKKLIVGLGISYLYVDDMLIETLESNHYTNVVFHVINGLFTKEHYESLKTYSDSKILILGFKDLRRGVTYHQNNNDEVETNQKWLYDNLKEISKNIKVISFDNLSLKQLDVKRLMTEEEWNRFYMGDDGTHTLFVDMVERIFAKSSTNLNRRSILTNMNEMFQIIKSDN
jgi:organic radical activating enzyme